MQLKASTPSGSFPDTAPAGMIKVAMPASNPSVPSESNPAPAPAACLLLAAFPPELGPWLEAPPQGWIAATCGIGAVEAAARTALLLARNRPPRLLFLGTCGALDPALPVGAVIAAGRVIATSLGELRGEAYRPKLETVEWWPGWALPFPACTVAIPPAITADDAGARLLGDLAQVEHLELSGVLAAAAAAGIPAAAALVVANPCGFGAHEAWLANHKRCSERLRESVALALGGPPAPGPQRVEQRIDPPAPPAPCWSDFPARRP